VAEERRHLGPVAAVDGEDDGPAGGAIWSPYAGDVTPALIAESHGLGLKIVVWTVNQEADIARLIEAGVDGIISDRPDLLRKVAAEKGLALPQGFPVTP